MPHGSADPWRSSATLARLRAGLATLGPGEQAGRAGRIRRARGGGRVVDGGTGGGVGNVAGDDGSGVPATGFPWIPTSSARTGPCDTGSRRVRRRRGPDRAGTSDSAGEQRFLVPIDPGFPVAVHHRGSQRGGAARLPGAAVLCADQPVVAKFLSDANLLSGAMSDHGFASAGGGDHVRRDRLADRSSGSGILPVLPSDIEVTSTESADTTPGITMSPLFGRDVSDVVSCRGTELRCAVRGRIAATSEATRLARSAAAVPRIVNGAVCEIEWARVWRVLSVNRTNSHSVADPG